MAFKWERSAPVDPAGLLADRRLYLSADGRLVEDGALDAAVLLAPVGTIIPAARAQELGLRLVEGRIVQGAEAEAAEPVEEPKPKRRKG